MVTLPKPGDKVAGKYVVESLIGRGGMGAVFRAKNTMTGRRVALKWIAVLGDSAPELEARLLREAQVMGRIEHPNVCAVLDVGQADGALFLVIEHLDGCSLGSWAEGREIEVAEAIQLLLPAMSGVAAAHDAGVVHRDLKPDNLFVCLDHTGAPHTTKVLDFGVSKLLDPGGDELGKLTRTGQAIGTPQFMAPEQIRGDSDLDARIDVYALGAILYQLISDRLPYEADNYSGLVVKIATSLAAPILSFRPNLDRKLAAIIHKAIAADRADRFASVVAFARALEPFADGAKFIVPQRRLGTPAEPELSSEAPTALATPAAPSPPWSSAVTGPLSLVAEVELTPAEPPARRMLLVAAALVSVTIAMAAAWRFGTSEAQEATDRVTDRGTATDADAVTATDAVTVTAAIQDPDSNMDRVAPRTHRPRIADTHAEPRANEPDAGHRIRSATGRAGVISTDEF